MGIVPPTFDSRRTLPSRLCGSRGILRIWLLHFHCPFRPARRQIGRQARYRETPEKRSLVKSATVRWFSGGGRGFPSLSVHFRNRYWSALYRLTSWRSFVPATLPRMLFHWSGSSMFMGSFVGTARVASDLSIKSTHDGGRVFRRHDHHATRAARATQGKHGRRAGLEAFRMSPR